MRTEITNLLSIKMLNGRKFCSKRPLKFQRRLYEKINVAALGHDESSYFVGFAC